MKRFLFIGFLVIVIFCPLACSLPSNLFPASPTPTAETSRTESADSILETETTASPTEWQTITVYFTDQEKFAVGILPYEVAVTRPMPEGVDPILAVLDAFFDGPTGEEADQGLVLVSSGFTGVKELIVKDGIARIYLEGKCANNGAAYSVASVIAKNLEQFPDIKAFKIYDENGNNLDPDSEFSSLPYCLEP